MSHEIDRRQAFIGICLGCSILALLLSGLIEGISYAPLRDLEVFTGDVRTRLGRKTLVSPELVLIGIDRPNYPASDFKDEDLEGAPILRELQKDFPWSRAVWAELTDKLVGAGAKVIAFDLVFGSPNIGDARLAEALAKHKDKVVIGCTLSTQKADRGDFLHLISPNSVVLPAADNEALVQDDRVAYVNIPKDPDGVVRRTRFRQTGAQAGFVVEETAVMESLASRVLQKFGRPDTIPPAFDLTRFRYGSEPGMGYKIHPIGDVLIPQVWEKNYENGSFFRDKIVLIGPTAGIFHDEHDTPFTQRQMNGPEVHLNILAAALQKQFLWEPPKAVVVLIIVMAGMLAGALSFHNFQPMQRLGTVVMSVASYWVLAQWCYDKLGWMVPVAAPLFALMGGGVLILFYDFFRERIDRVKLKHTMGLYFSPTVLEAVLADPGSMQPKHADVTLLLTDLRNSTPLAEILGPQGMFDLLNQVFEAQTNVIMKEEGNLEHFLGDQFLSYWGAPKPQPDAADRALRAAYALITAMEALRASFSKEILEIFGYGVALHSGRVLVGNKGSAKRLDYGLVGDSVNAASRIESLTKYYGVRLLVSRDTFSQLTNPGIHRLVDRAIVKGKTEPIELLECENFCTPPNYGKLCEAYTAAYALYSEGHFAEAQAAFEGLHRTFSDGASQTLGERCQQLALNPPPDWRGVWKMDSK
jgi:adenylate cyclase